MLSDTFTVPICPEGLHILQPVLVAGCRLPAATLSLDTGFQKLVLLSCKKHVEIGFRSKKCFLMESEVKSCELQ